MARRLCCWRAPSRRTSSAPDKPKRWRTARRSARVGPAPPAGSSSGAEQTWILLGCDGAGKSTLAAALCERASRSDTTPTCGFTTASATLRRQRLRLFDVGGGAGIRAIWDNYYAEAHAAIFVVDASDVERLEEARRLLHAACAHANLAGKPLLIVGNKSDLPHAAGTDELAAALGAHALAAGPRGVCRTSALSDAVAARERGGSDDSLASSLDWLATTVQQDFGSLEERRRRQAAEQAEEELRRKEERKARLAAKRAERERAEAAEQAASGEAVADLAGALDHTKLCDS